jgi:hypothetical protein
MQQKIKEGVVVDVPEGVTYIGSYLALVFPDPIKNPIQYYSQIDGHNEVWSKFLIHAELNNIDPETFDDFYESIKKNLLMSNPYPYDKDLNISKDNMPMVSIIPVFAGTTIIGE